MKPLRNFLSCVRVLALGGMLALGVQAQAQAPTDPLPSWNDGAPKKAIADFVQTTTTQGSPNFVPPAERIAMVWPLTLEVLAFSGASDAQSRLSRSVVGVRELAG